ncbi:TPA: DUF3108 domain-containing protein [Candidatus Poribacteria bacterium]|nr:DUF3108 domain-containing protein [Candidatus Poribacteria bacterium]HIM11360.1 DUF3108 domain-containing protein [Candidatus Poribacteria bacterium]HIO80796.1 DUF3108 domain-containing protein [Candidatus Poribacteria bacterium]
MNKKLTEILEGFCFLCISMVAAEATSLLESESFIPIRVGEELVYKATFAGLVAGEQILAVDKETRFNNQKVFHVHSETRTGGLFDKLYHFFDHKESYITTDNLFPIRHTKYLEDRKYRASVEVNFDQKNGKIYYLKNKEYKEFSAPVGIQDELSMIFFVRTRKLEVGRNYQFPLFVKGKPQHITLSVSKRETLNTKIGQKQTMVLETSHGHRIWLTDDKLRIPVRIEAKLRFGKLIGALERINLK